MDEESGFSWMPIGLVAGLAVGLGLFLIYKPDPPSPPNNDAAFGCYAADEAPAIRLDQNGMHIRQNGFNTIGYHLERHKTGIALVAERPIDAQRAEGAYRFSVANKGQGKFLRFFRDGSDSRYGVFEADNLQSFEMVTKESSYLLYRKAEPELCLNITY